MNYNAFVKLVDENYIFHQQENIEKLGSFLQELEKLLSKNFGIPSCEVEITSLKPSHFAFGRVPPAAFRIWEATETKTHYLTHYYLHINKSVDIPAKYLDFILKSDEVKKLDILNLKNKLLAQGLQKLSPSEFVADLFARDMLVKISEKSSNPTLALDAADKIEREEKMQNQFLQNINSICNKDYTNAKQIKFHDIVNSQTKKDIEQTP